MNATSASGSLILVIIGLVVRLVVGFEERDC